MAVELRNFVPVLTIEIAAVVVVLLIALGLLYKYGHWRRVVPPPLFRDARRHLGLWGMARVLLAELGNRVALQRDIITDSRIRWLTHFLIFWGFIGLAFATTWVFIFYRDGTPRPFTDPGKIVGNIGGVMLLIGTTIILLRYALIEKYRRGRLGDISFFILLYLATITGFTTQFARVAGGELLAYTNYALHLALVLGLLVTAPFTHFLHAVLVPFLRYVERLQSILIGKGLHQYTDYRQLVMAELAELVRAGREKPLYPSWLRTGASSEGERKG